MALTLIPPRPRALGSLAGQATIDRIDFDGQAPLQISAGKRSTCAVLGLGIGDWICFGENEHGMLGIPGTTARQIGGSCGAYCDPQAVCCSKAAEKACTCNLDQISGLSGNADATCNPDNSGTVCLKPAAVQASPGAQRALPTAAPLLLLLGLVARLC